MWSSGEDLIHSGGPREEKRGALANGGNSEVRVSDSVWAFSDESASLDFSWASGCGSAAGLWLLGFSTGPGFLKQPLLGGEGERWQLGLEDLLCPEATPQLLRLLA